MTLIDKYIGYLTHVRRFSPRTVAIYHDALKNYLRIIHKASEVADRLLLESLNRSEIRQYVVAVMEEGLSARTVGFGLGQANNVFLGIGGSLTTQNMEKVQTTGGLVECFFIAGRVAKITKSVLLYNSSGFGIVLFLANNLLHM